MTTKSQEPTKKNKLPHIAAHQITDPFRILEIFFVIISTPSTQTNGNMMNEDMQIM